MASRRPPKEFAWAPLGRFTMKRELRDGPRAIAGLRRHGFGNRWTLSAPPAEWSILVKGVLQRRLLLHDATGLLASLQDDLRHRSATVSWRDGRTWRWTQTSMWQRGQAVLTTTAGDEVLQVLLGKGGTWLVAVEGDGGGLSELEVAQLVALHYVFLLSPTWNPLDGIGP